MDISHHPPIIDRIIAGTNESPWQHDGPNLTREGIVQAVAANEQIAKQLLMMARYFEAMVPEAPRAKVIEFKRRDV